MDLLKSSSFFNPSEEELKRLGLSRSAYEDNWVWLAKIGGTLYFNRTFTIAYHLPRVLALFTMCGFVYGSLKEGDREDSFDCVQYILVIMMMYGGCSAFLYYHDEYLGLLRMIGKGGFDYEGTLTREAELEIEQFRARTKLFKEAFKKIFLVVLAGTIFSIVGKKPLARLIFGKGKKAVDGENNLIWSSPFGMYWPYADYWISYWLGMAFSNVTTIWICVGNIAYAAAFLLTAEGLLSEFHTVNCTFRHCLVRAKLLYNTKINNGFTKAEKYGLNSMDDCLRYCLHLSMEHHQRSLKAFKSLKTIMFLPLFALIVGWAMVTCLSVYLILSDDVSLVYKLPLPVMIFAEAFVAFLYCNYGQRFTDACEEIGKSIYEGSDWAEHGDLLKSYMSIMNGYCNLRNGFSAGGFGQLDHSTFLSMVSTAYSYIGFLLSARHDSSPSRIM